MTRPRLHDHIDGQLVTAIAELPATLERLRGWTGEFPASTIGAAPPSAPRRDVPVDADDSDGGTGSPMLSLDGFQRTLDEVTDIVDQLGETARQMLGVLGYTVGERGALPMLLALLWSPQATDERLRKRWRFVGHRVDRLVDIIEQTKPATTTATVSNCHAHEKAGDPHEPTDVRYRHLCGFCGRFRSVHGVYPPPEIVRLHARGIRIMPSHLKRAGIKA